MPDFAFLAIHADGKRRRGRATAATDDALVRDLEARGLTVVTVRPRGGDADDAFRVPRARISDAVRAVAELLAAGVPLTRTFDIAATSTHRSLAAVLTDIRARIERGEGVATAMAAHPRVFSAAAVGVARAGEHAGDLDGAFARLAAQLERDDAQRAQLLSAAIYPAVLAIAGGAAILMLLLFVLPRFAALLNGTGLPLPRSTALLLAAAEMLRAHWTAIPFVALALLAAGMWTRSSASGRRAGARLLLALPVVGAYRRDALAAECARVLAVLLRGGTPLALALDAAAPSVADPLLRDALLAVRARVVAGSALHRALESEPIFGELFVSLVATGEESGRLADFLERAAALFEQRTVRGAQRLVAIAEPAMIVAFGAVVGCIALSLLQAIYGINGMGIR